MGKAVAVPKMPSRSGKVHRKSEPVRAVAPHDVDLAGMEKRFSRETAPGDTDSLCAAIPAGIGGEAFLMAADKSLSSMSGVRNGLVGVLVKETLVRCVRRFILRHVATLDGDARSELGVLLYCHLFNASPKMRSFLIAYKAKPLGLKLVNMMEWLFTTLLRADLQVYELLRHLGEEHRTRLKVSASMYGQFCVAWDRAMSEHFGYSYSFATQQSFEAVFEVVCCIMTGDSAGEGMAKQVQMAGSTSTAAFLKSIETCIRDPFGFPLLCRFLDHELCPELPVFFNLFKRFTAAMSDVERLMVSRNIVQTCITDGQPFELNLPFLTKQYHRELHSQFEEAHKAASLVVPRDSYQKVYVSMRRLVRSNYWGRFADTVKSVQL